MTASPPPTSPLTALPASEVPQEPSLLPPSLAKLAEALGRKEHLLATEGGDEEMAKLGLESAQGLFDLGLALEPSSHPHLHPLLQSLLTPSALTTRSRSAASSAAVAEPTTPLPTTILPYTPSSGLYTSGMTPDQVYAQMEMRAGVVGGLLSAIGLDLPREEEEMLGGPESEESEDGESGDEDEDEEMGEEEEREMREMMRMYEAGELEEGGIGEDEEDDEGDSEEESDSEEGDSEDEDEMDEDEEMDFSDDGGEEAEGAQAGPSRKSRKAMLLDDDEEEDEDVDMEDMDASGDEEDEEDEEEAAFGVSSKSKKSHPTLDDRFFSIDEFNRLTEESEATAMSAGRLSLAEGSEDEEEDDDEGEGGEALEGVFGGPVGGEDVDGDMMYSDFFAPPPRERTIAKPRSDKFKLDKKGKGKAVDEDVDVDMEESGRGKGKGKSKGKGREPPMGDISEYGRQTMIRVRGDLFADDEEMAEEAILSTHEKRQLALASQIASLESENVGEKDWVLLGEAGARARPENSLLEEELDFEQVGKVVPEITEERVKSLEEVIKRRILDNNFDDIVRKREMDDKAFLPSRYFDLQDSQSSKSLAQIYEDDYTAASSGTKVVDPRDAKLTKEHEEIERIWGEIGWKLDALSNLNYTPKQPKAAITTISNIASTTLESALPTTQSTSTLLAPEEMFAPPKASALVARSELEPEEKRKSRTKARKQKMKMRQGLDGAVGKFAGRQGLGGGKARGGVKGEKDRALAELVKTGKGVTVVGKQPVRKRGTREDTSTTQQATRLKL